MRYNRKHGMTGTDTYRCWVSMRQRCSDKSHPSYYDYGGRGIKVCKRWDSFTNFLEDMGEKPKNMSIERINNFQGYYPENCRWASKAQQARNRRTNKLNQEKADEIRRLYKMGNISQKELGVKYGVDTSLISYVINNKIWS